MEIVCGSSIKTRIKLEFNQINQIVCWKLCVGNQLRLKLNLNSIKSIQSCVGHYMQSYPKMEFNYGLRPSW